MSIGCIREHISRSSIICAVVEWPDHHCGENLVFHSSHVLSSFQLLVFNEDTSCSPVNRSNLFSSMCTSLVSNAPCVKVHVKSISSLHSPLQVFGQISLSKCFTCFIRKRECVFAECYLRCLPRPPPSQNEFF